MSIAYEQRLCEFCLSKSDILPPEDHDKAGWTTLVDLEGLLDRCPPCTAAGRVPGPLLAAASTSPELPEEGDR